MLVGVWAALAPHLLRSRGNSIKADVGEEELRGAIEDVAPAKRHERCEVLLLALDEADNNCKQQRMKGVLDDSVTASNESNSK